jgi:transposase
MKGLLEELRATQVPTPVKIEFHLMPEYSPKLNPVEYAIHLLRLRCLHHADSTTSLQQAVERIVEVCKQGTILSKQQIKNLLRHIASLVKPVTV